MVKQSTPKNKVKHKILNSFPLILCGYSGKFGTEPILTLLLLLCGLLAGFRYMYKTYMRFFGEELKGDDHKHG